MSDLSVICHESLWQDLYVLSDFNNCPISICSLQEIMIVLSTGKSR